MSGKRRGWNANLPTRWLTDPAIRDLSGDALATHVMALIYGIEHENDGALERSSLRWLLPATAEASIVTAELVAAGLWDVADNGFQIVDWSATQTTRAEMDRTRKQNRDRQREYQKRQKGTQGPVDPATPPTSRMTNALLTQPPEIRKDQANTGKDKQTSDEPQAAGAWRTRIPGTEQWQEPDDVWTKEPF